MVTGMLSVEAYETLRNHLMKKAHIEPMEVGYTVDMCICGVDYTVKLVLDKHRQVAVLQANRIDRYRNGPGDQLITGGFCLGCLRLCRIVSSYNGICCHIEDF